MKKLIETLPKNSVEELRIGLDEFKGHDLLSLRLYYEGDKGDWLPTKKGINVKVEMLPDLIAALEKARDEAVQAGILDDGRPF